MPLLKMPWRAPDKLGGVAPAVLLPNLPSLSDADLKAHLSLWTASISPLWSALGAGRRPEAHAARRGKKSVTQVR